MSLFCVVETSQAQVTANCRSNTYSYINYFGVDTVWAADLNNGSVGASRFLVNGEAYVRFTCSDIGTHSLVFTAVDTMTGQADTCVGNVQVLDLVAPQAICLSNLNISLDSFGNGSLQATQLDPSGASYDACGIISYSINGNASLPLSCADTGTQAVTLVLVDANGNASTCMTNVHVSDPGYCTQGPLDMTLDTVIHTRCDTNICTGEVSIAVAGGWPPYLLVWSDGLTATTLLRANVCAGNYTVTVTDALGTTAVLNFDVETLPGCVWPGDTDNNHEARNFDLLPIALAYAQNGLLRPNASNLWHGEASPNWNIATSIVDLPDWKHIDADGNAHIDSLDLDVVLQNYQQQYYPVLPTILSPQGPIPFFVDTMQVDEGQPVTIPINLGTAASPADSVYALAFSIVYDSTMVEQGSVQVSFDGSWLGADLLTIYKDYPTNGRTEIALGRKNHQPINGFGNIAHITFTIRDDIFRAPLARYMPIRIEAVRLIDEQNRLKPVTGIAGQLQINEVLGLSNVSEAAPHASIFPNPANESLTVVLNNASLQSWALYNTAGQKLMEEANPNMFVNVLNVSQLPSGLYLLQLQTNQNVLQKTVLIRR